MPAWNGLRVRFRAVAVRFLLLVVRLVGSDRWIQMWNRIRQLREIQNIGRKQLWEYSRICVRVSGSLFSHKHTRLAHWQWRAYRSTVQVQVAAESLHEIEGKSLAFKLNLGWPCHHYMHGPYWWWVGRVKLNSEQWTSVRAYDSDNANADCHLCETLASAKRAKKTLAERDQVAYFLIFFFTFKFVRVVGPYWSDHLGTWIWKPWSIRMHVWSNE